MVHYRSLAIVCLASGFGLIGWHTNFHGFAILIFLTPLWSLCSSRLHAFITMLAYYLSASISFPFGIYQFFDHALIPSITLWISHHMLLASVWVLFFYPRMRSLWQVIWRVSVTWIIGLIIPPFCLIGWAHPFIAAGYYFPGSGMMGLMLFFALTISISFIILHIDIQRAFPIFGRVKVSMLLLIVASMIYYQLYYYPLDAPSSWIGVNTDLGASLREPTKRFDRHMALQMMSETLIKNDAHVIIFPESIAGKWTELEEALWEQTTHHLQQKNAVILLGAEVPVSSSIYENSVIFLGDKADKKRVAARIPMPVGNWNPFSRQTALLNLWDNNHGVATIKDIPVAVVICYEIMLFLPLLDSFLSVDEKPQLILLVSNLWWAKNTDISHIMHQVLHAWGRLWGVPFMQVTNR